MSQRVAMCMTNGCEERAIRNDLYCSRCLEKKPFLDGNSGTICETYNCDFRTVKSFEKCKPCHFSECAGRFLCGTCGFYHNNTANADYKICPSEDGGSEQCLFKQSNHYVCDSPRCYFEHLGKRVITNFCKHHFLSHNGNKALIPFENLLHSMYADESKSESDSHVPDGSMAPFIVKHQEKPIKCIGEPKSSTSSSVGFPQKKKMDKSFPLFNLFGLIHFALPELSDIANTEIDDDKFGANDASEDDTYSYFCEIFNNKSSTLTPLERRAVILKCRETTSLIFNTLTQKLDAFWEEELRKNDDKIACITKGCSGIKWKKMDLCAKCLRQELEKTTNVVNKCSVDGCKNSTWKNTDKCKQCTYEELADEMSNNSEKSNSDQIHNWGDLPPNFEDVDE
jgi:hypothetical protein